MELNKQQLNGLLYDFLDTIYIFQQIESGLFEVTWQQIYMLQILRKTGPRNVGELGTALRIPLFAASRLCKRMEEAGYVSKARDTRYHREIVVSLTEAGNRLLDQVEDYHYRLIQSNLNLLSPEEFDHLHSGLGKLRALLSVDAPMPVD